jgi:hypothetical protein
MGKAMRTLFALLVCSPFISAIPGCGSKATEFQATKSIKITYTVNGNHKDVTISDAKELKEILGTISVDYTEDSAPGWIVRNKVSFQLPDDKGINLFIARKGVLDRPEHGLIILKDTKFYDKINEVLTKKENRKIDVLVNNIQNPFEGAKNISIEYTLQGKKNTLTVEDAKQVKEIVSAMHIQQMEEGPQVGLKPKCTVGFTMTDKTTIRIMFVKASQLERSFWGPIYLNDTDFYDKINEVVSKKEGKKIDVLKDNN